MTGRFARDAYGMPIESWLLMLLEDIATAPAVDTQVRHDLLADVLAPLGPVEADRTASKIEQPAYWVRNGQHACDADATLATATREAAYFVCLALAVGVTTSPADTPAVAA